MNWLSYKNGQVFITHRIGRDWPHPEHKAYRIEPLKGLISRWLRWFFGGFVGEHWRSLRALYISRIRIREWDSYKAEAVVFGDNGIRRVD